MRACDIEEGKIYHLKNNKAYKEIKVLKVLYPNDSENENNFIVVKCLHSSLSTKCETTRYKNALIRYFRPRDIIKVDTYE